MDIEITDLKIELEELDKILDEYDRIGLTADNSPEVRALIADYELEWKERIEDWDYKFFIVSDDEFRREKERNGGRSYISILNRIDYWNDYLPTLILSAIKSYRDFLYWERMV